MSDLTWALALLESTQKVNEKLINRIAEAQGRITAIREYHVSTPFNKHFICSACQEHWPCKTIVMLDGN